jgi:hypothetical protein
MERTVLELPVLLRLLAYLLLVFLRLLLEHEEVSMRDLPVLGDVHLDVIAIDESSGLLEKLLPIFVG